MLSEYRSRHISYIQNRLVLSIGLFCILMLPCISSSAQNTGKPADKVDFATMVSARDEGVKKNIALVPVAGVDITLHMSDGNSYHKLSDDMSPVIFKGLPSGCEYVAELSGEGYSTAIYHGRIPEKTGYFPQSFDLNRTDGSSSKEQVPFKDTGRADVEGFVTCPADIQYITEPLPDAFVLYTSSADSLYTTTDQHGYFRFEGVKDRNGKVSVSHMTCKSVESTVPPEDGSRWLWLTTEVDMLKLAASKITSSMPVISIAGDTVRYNVAATQKVMHGDRLGDVLERLPGMTMENGTVKVFGKPLYEILINDTDLFGRSQHDALSYLAGVQINKIDVYERSPKNGDRRLTMNVRTKRFLKNLTDIDVNAAGGANMPLSTGNFTPPERWQAGLGARYFSVPLITTLDLGTNNLGIESGRDLSKIPDIQSGNSDLIKPVFASVKVQKALKLNEKKTYAIQTLDFNYSYKKREVSSEKYTERSYNPDEDWTDRRYEKSQLSKDNNLTHTGELKWDSREKWHPNARIAVSRNEHGRWADLMSIDETSVSEQDVNVVSLHQISELNSSNYKIEGNAGASCSDIPDYVIRFNMSFNGGEGDGGEVRRDSTSTRKTWITSDEGKNRHISSDIDIKRRIDKKSIGIKYAFNYDYGLQRKLNYDEVVDDAHLSPLTSEDSRSNIYRHSLEAAFQAEKISASLGFQTSHVLDSREFPFTENVNKVFPAPVMRIGWNSRGSFYERFSLSASMNSTVPTLNQLGSVFHDSNPLYVSRGNPDLKQTQSLSIFAYGVHMISAGILDYNASFSYRINEVVSTRTYYSEDTILDGYTLPAGATFSTFANCTGGMRFYSIANYSVSIQPLRYKVDLSAGYEFNRTPSFINEKFELYNSHTPSLSIDATSCFSTRFKLDFRAGGSLDHTESQLYGTTRYRTWSASVNSDNRITDWFFVRAGYRHTARIPMSDRIIRMDADMLNVSTGVLLMDSKLNIAVIFRDLLNNAPSISTKAYSDYLEMVRTNHMNRYMLLSIRYVFNSSEK